MARFKNITYTIGGTDYTIKNGMTRGGYSGNEWRNCDICGQSFPESKIRKFRGADYGIPCSCYLDIVSIMRNEQIEKTRVETNEEA